MQECMTASLAVLYDGGDPDAANAECNRSCIAGKEKARAATLAASRTPPPDPPLLPDPPLTTRLFPVTIVLVIAGAFGGIAWEVRRRRDQAWATAMQNVAREAAAEEARTRFASIEAALEAAGASDAKFSRVLFEDFLYAIYAEVHAARGGANLARVGPYLSDLARSELEKYPADAIEGVIVGAASLRGVRVYGSTGAIRAVVQFEANYTERRDTDTTSYYAREAWTFERSPHAAARTPDHARVIGCANCGAPLTKIAGGVCEHCKTPAANAIDWRVVGVDVITREARGPILTGTTEEKGTEDPTLVAADVQARFRELCESEPSVTWASLTARIDLVFRTFHRAWSAQELAVVRPYLSDLLFETQRYWVAAYRAQGLRNVTEDPKIVTMHLSKVTRDPFFHAVTVRVFATCKDYTLDAKGNVVGGDRSTERRYSEYWTFLRTTSGGGPAKSEGCPSCGAPLEGIGMSGVCASCHAKVTSGEFDWVLSRIEQDEVYALS